MVIDRLAAGPAQAGLVFNGVVLGQEIETVTAQPVAAGITDVGEVQALFAHVPERQGRADAHAGAQFDAQIVHAEVDLVHDGGEVQLGPGRLAGHRPEHLIHGAVRRSGPAW